MATSSTASETTPLLGNGAGDLEALGLGARAEPPLATDKAAGKPLPKLQLFLLCYGRMLEPIAFFSIFPYVPQMVQRIGGLPDSDVGFYSGLVESLFSATQMLVLIFWGRLADRVGRKPVLVYCLAGMAAGPALFGLATSLWQMLLFRCLAGVFSGSGLIIRTMIGDRSTPETQAAVYSAFGIAGNVGVFLGPVLGGLLADPVTSYPGLFGRARILAVYPYALPGLAIGLLSASGALVSALFLEETLDKGTAIRRRNGSAASGPPPAPSMGIWELMRAPGVAAVLTLYCHTMVLTFAFTAILPVALFTRVALGGLGCSSFQISLYMTAQGASQALWLVLVFPRLQRRAGTRGVLALCACTWPFFFAGYVAMNALLRLRTGAALAGFWAVGSVIAFIGPGVSMSFTAVQLALNDASPSVHMLGTLNAVALTCASAIRTVVPGLSTAVYAIGVRNQILSGHLAWVILILVSAGLVLVLRWK